MKDDLLNVNNETIEEVAKLIKSQRVELSERFNMHPVELPSFLKAYLTEEEITEYKKTFSDYWAFIDRHHEASEKPIARSSVLEANDVYLADLVNIFLRATELYTNDLKKNPNRILEDIDLFIKNDMSMPKNREIVKRDRKLSDLTNGRIDYSKAEVLKDGSLVISEKDIAGNSEMTNPEYIVLLSDRGIVKTYILNSIYPIQAFLNEFSEKYQDEQLNDQLQMDIGICPVCNIVTIINTVNEKLRNYTDSTFLSKRTIANAKDVSSSEIVSDVSNRQTLALISSKSFSGALDFAKNDNSYLSKLNKESLNLMKVENGKIYFEGFEGSEAELRDIHTKEGIEDIDKVFLQIIYTVFYNQYQACIEEGTPIKESLTVYFPDLFKFMYDRSSWTKEDLERIIDKIKSYHDVTGVMNNRSEYQVLTFNYYNSDKNLLSFSSPYFKHLIEKVEEKKETVTLSVQKNKKLEYPKYTHSHLVKSTIYTEKNKIAISLAESIVLQIEQAGTSGGTSGRTIKVKASRLINNNYLAKERLENSKNKTSELKRLFSATLRILKEQTFLEEEYKDIKLPDYNNPANIPTQKTLNTMVFVITHNGRKKTRS